MAKAQTQETPQMHIVIETMTPENAEKILLRSLAQKQRTLVQSRVRRIARAIQDGQWRVTHQPIAITEEGVLIDGQHRLAAVSMAGLNVPMLTAYDADPGTFDVVDTGASRSPGNMLTIAGYANTNVLASAARYYLIYRDLLGTAKVPSGENRNKYTPHDIMRLIESPSGKLLQASHNTASRIAIHLGKHGIVTWLAAAITLLDESGADIQLRTEFLEKLENGTMLEPGAPVLAFRRWLISDTGYSRMQKHHAGYAGMAIFTKAWNAWLAGDMMQVAAFRVGTESTPKFARNYTKGVDGKPVDLEQLDMVTEEKHFATAS